MNEEIQLIADVIASAKREGCSEWSTACSVRSALERSKWNAPVSVTARRGDVAAAAQCLGHANNPSAEALRFKALLREALGQ